MLYCNNCAKALDEDLQFCPDCGEEDPFWTAPVIPQGQFRGEVFDRLREINKRIDENSDAGSEDEPVTQTPMPETYPGAGSYIALLSLAVCFWPGGLILGILYATRKNPHFRSLGIVTIVLTVSVFVITALLLAATMIII